MHRIQRAWRKYQEGRVQAHPQLKGQDDNAVLDDCKVRSIKEQFKTGAHDTTSSYSMLKQSSSQHHPDSSLASKNVELVDTQPRTVPQAAMPTSEFDDPKDHPSVWTSISQNRECSVGTSTEQESSKAKLKCMSIHPVQHFGLENTFKNGTNHNIVQLLTPVKSLDNKALAINKEGIKSSDDRYRLCYTIELSDSSADEDRNWPAGSEDIDFLDTATGDNLAMEGFNNNTHCGKLYKPLL